MGFLDSAKDFVFGTDPEVQSIETLSPEQAKVSRKLGPLLEGKLDQPLDRYGGQVVAGLSPFEQQYMQRIQALQGQPTPMQGDLMSAYQRALSGQPSTTVDPQAQQQLYEESIFKPAMREFKESILPTIEERFVGPGFYSSAREKAIQDASTDFAQDLASKRAELFYSDEQARRGLAESAADRAVTAAPGALGFASYQRERPYTEAQLLGEAGALTRILNQAQLDWNYNEFLRTRPESSPYLNMALQYLGIPMTGYVGFEGTDGIMADLIKAGASAAGSFGGGGAAAASDQRLKDDIKGVGKVNGINLYTWKWKPGFQEVHRNAPGFGAIAQEVQLTNPDAVVTGDHGYLMIDYSKLFGGV